MSRTNPNTSGGGGPVTGLTGTATQIVYIGNGGTGTGDTLATRNSATQATNIIQDAGSDIRRGLAIDTFIPANVLLLNYDTVTLVGSLVRLESDAVRFSVADNVQQQSVTLNADLSGTPNQGALDFNDDNLNTNSRFNVRNDSAIMVFAKQVTPSIISNRIIVDTDGVTVQNNGGGATPIFELWNGDTSDTYFLVNPVTGNYAIGDIDASANSTQITIEDGTEVITCTADVSFQIEDSTGHDWFQVNPTASQVYLGDIPGTGNATRITVQDAIQTISLEAPTILAQFVPTYADDAAAAGGGLASGTLYKTTTAGSTYLKIVP